jgi:hypothetical protein
MVDGVPDRSRYSFDEYKLYYESTEKVTDRRLATNAWNYALCTAIMVAMATLASWSLSRPDFRLVTIVAILMLAGMGMLLCTLWIGQIRDFKALNNAKFEVLNAMAPHVQFGANDDRASATPFAREWEILKTKEATQEVYTTRIVALRSSNAEFLVPTAFRWLFAFIVATALIIVVMNWSSLINGIFEIKQPVNPVGVTTTAPSNTPAGRP